MINVFAIGNVPTVSPEFIQTGFVILIWLVGVGDRNAISDVVSNQC